MIELSKIHKASREEFDREFDCEVERQRLVRLTGDQTIEVAEFIDNVMMLAGAHGVKMIPLHESKAPPPKSYLVRYWRGKVWNAAYKRNGMPFDFGPYFIKYYHPDRVAEILRKHREAK